MCPQLVEYGVEDQDRAAAELATLGANSELARMAIGYKQLREQTRACLGHSH